MFDLVFSFFSFSCQFLRSPSSLSALTPTPISANYPVYLRLSPLTPAHATAQKSSEVNHAFLEKGNLIYVASPDFAAVLLHFQRVHLEICSYNLLAILFFPGCMNIAIHLMKLTHDS